MLLDEKIAIIRHYVPRLREKISHLSDTQLTKPYLPGEWTIAQNVHHLFDSHMVAYLMCNQVLVEENVSLSWPDQDALAQLPNAKSSNLEPSLTGLEGLHERWANLFQDVTDWARFGTDVDTGETYTIEQLLDIYSRHCENHLHQIQSVLNAM